MKGVGGGVVGVESDGFGEGFGDREVGEQDGGRGTEATEGVDGRGEKVGVVGGADGLGCIVFFFFGFGSGDVCVGVRGVRKTDR